MEDELIMVQIKLLKREEVALEDTWDLTKIFTNDEAWEETLERVSKSLVEKSKYQGTLNKSAQSLLEALEWQLAIFREGEKISVYASMKHDEDTTNPKYQVFEGKAISFFARLSEATSWFEPELLEVPAGKLAMFFSESTGLSLYRHFIEKILDKKAHINSPQIESLLSKVSDVLTSSLSTFEILNNADLKFGEIANEKGEFVQLSHGNFFQLLESNNRHVRKESFEKFHVNYEQFGNTLASTLNGEIKSHVFTANSRNYSSARAASLAQNNIPEEVYDMLVEAVNKNLSLLHRYIKLRKDKLNLDELHSYDLQVPLLEETTLKFTYEQSKTKVLEAVAPLGKDYLKQVKHIFDNRVIDVRENAGKRSGAYSGGAYDTEPYILLNWHDSLSNLYTLIHELGHSMHSFYSRTNQKYVYSDYSIFLAEIASTTNENILTEYLLRIEKDEKTRAYILNNYLDDFRSTMFRQTQFAEFEQYLHEQVESGTPLTSQALNAHYEELISRYYGKYFTLDPQVALEWVRIPHFYYNYYVFQYATGFAAATALSQKIINGDKEDLENYLGYLRAGSSDYPLEIIKKTGVDMNKPKYLEESFVIFEKRLVELEKLLG